MIAPMAGNAPPPAREEGRWRARGECRGGQAHGRYPAGGDTSGSHLKNTYQDCPVGSGGCTTCWSGCFLFFSSFSPLFLWLWRRMECKPPPDFSHAWPSPARASPLPRPSFSLYPARPPFHPPSLLPSTFESPLARLVHTFQFHVDEELEGREGEREGGREGGREGKRGNGRGDHFH